MALATHSDLQTALVEWLARDGDAALVNRAPDFVSLFEADIKTTLRVRQMEIISDALTIPGTASLPLPDDYLEMRNVYLNTNPITELNFVTPQQYFSLRASSETGEPKIYSIQDSAVYFGAIPNAVYGVAMNYYAFTPLSEDDPTNWLLTNYPGAYLYGSIYQAACYLNDDAAEQKFGSKMETVLDRIRADDKRARYAGTLTMRSDVTVA